MENMNMYRLVPCSFSIITTEPFIVNYPVQGRPDEQKLHIGLICKLDDSGKELFRFSVEADSLGEYSFVTELMSMGQPTRVKLMKGDVIIRTAFVPNR